MTTNTKKVTIWPIDTEPMLSILRHPKLTILFALKFKPLSYFIKVGILGSFASSLVGFLGVHLTATATLGQVVFSSFITAIIAYFFVIALLSTFVYYIGAALKGKGKFKAIFRAFSLTLIPYIWTLPLILFWMQLSPQTFFFISFDEATTVDLLFGIAGPIALIAATIWTLVLTFHSITVVHQFSKWKSIATLVIVLVAFVFATRLLSLLLF